MSGEVCRRPCLAADSREYHASAGDRPDNGCDSVGGHRCDCSREVERRLKRDAKGLASVGGHPVATGLRIGHPLGQQRQNEVVDHRLGGQKTAGDLDDGLGSIDEDDAYIHAVMMAERAFDFVQGSSLSSGAYAVVEMNEAVSEAALIEQFESRPDVVRQGAFAAANHDRAQEEMALIDKAGADRLAGEIAAPD